jgi:hypothetical protein
LEIFECRGRSATRVTHPWKASKGAHREKKQARALLVKDEIRYDTNVDTTLMKRASMHIMEPRVRNISQLGVFLAK